MEITAKLVKDLRDQTGAGMMKCKEALVECKGNLEEAIDYLRKKGLASADKKAGRATSQGLILPIASTDGTVAAIFEINCETDFVARNEKFQKLTSDIAAIILKDGNLKTVADLDAAKMASGETVEAVRKNLIATMGENVSLGRFERFERTAPGVFDTYIHGDGALGVLVELSCSSAEVARNDAVKAVAHEIALQVAAMKPRFVNQTEIPEAFVAREKSVITGQIQNDPKNRDKPENILSKIIDGRLAKYYKEYCLVEQIFIKDDSKCIQDLLLEVGKKSGGTVDVVRFRRWAIGEDTSSPLESSAEPQEANCASCAQ